MTFELGTRPNDLKVFLTEEADFNSTITNDDGDWAGTASIELRFGQDPDDLTATWTATLDGADAVFSIDKADVDTVLATKDKAVGLFYVDGALDLCWATGFIRSGTGTPGMSFSPVVGFPVTVVVPVPGPPGAGNVTDDVVAPVLAQALSRAEIDARAALAASGKQDEAEKGQPDGYASLDGAGLLPVANLPAISITSVTVVASQAAMLALDVQQGDVAIRTDFTPNKAYILTSNSPATLADWKDITATDLVQSVADLAGNISASALVAALEVALAALVSSGGTFETALTAKFAKLNSAGQGSIYVPPGSLDNWKAARAAHAASAVPIVGWGDSIMQGYYSSNLRTKSFFGKLITDLQATYSDGGSGFHSVINATGIGAAGATYMTLTGSWSAYPWSVNESMILPTTPGTGTITIPGVRGTTIDIYWSYNNAAATAFTYSIDGAAAVTVNIPIQTPDLGNTTITGLSSGAHTVVITATVSQPAIYGVTGRNATGIIGHNMGKQGRKSGDGTGASGLISPRTPQSVSITEMSPALCIVALSVNDVGAAVTADTFATNLHRIARNARAYNGGSCDLMFVTPHAGSMADASYLYAKYAAATHGVARAFGASWVNMWGAGRNSWDKWNALGYWGITNSATGNAGTDGAHPGDTGHAAIESPILALLNS